MKPPRMAMDKVLMNFFMVFTRLRFYYLQTIIIPRMFTDTYQITSQNLTYWSELELKNVKLMDEGKTVILMPFLSPL